MAKWTTNMKLDPIDPYTEDDVLFEWGDFLNGADVAVAEVTAVNATVQSFNIVNSAQDVSCRFTSGIIGLDAEITCKITTSDGTPRKEKRTTSIPVRSL
jgi:hypothetical protein